MADDKHRLTHIDEEGRARMVDVGDKDATHRLAVAEGWVRMLPDTLQAIRANKVQKGDVLTVAQIAGIAAAKRTSDWIPLCHPLQIDAINVSLTLVDDIPGVKVEARASLTGRTGAEMEALVAVSSALLTVYDMCKAIDRGMEIGPIRLVEKSGGRSGTWRRREA
ncbi:MAG: cyclic pyranopterin monophosphate synthase MoaC [Gemmatimonadetes bacterium]|uniref:Cyclic pyranopterin monophosphate synthase n=1 Tax=Candidatus Kutchimonas denitrificans TaxID=3056748 RepID=A0AAE5CBA1_9BACT|nr:cyclic pyranopterin monophosphate synthase MoaC [Gemmatimonadota bacterium]NIR75557.1 cyclic pyranopterin monophosphate synthase MoaC [Candidatus Kutchimonas denitrificans]NIS01871.1 cyclic pyranopterin monophosphate synthase MoaC [Gemmatimonadota bacterium]NIT67652.1 cyclic pyranopterin monophosphate synthase MoaC [Gemmatimonadota bacterium]NIU53526.1 cyclic pyranopterin monophosphate synthase MoaC [Gemmatimonadota bacterium]